MAQSLLDAAVLGVIEGLTEFIPVSSTGHLILADKVLGRTGESAALFDVVIQTGAILAVIWLMRKYLFGIVRGLKTDPKARHTSMIVTIAFLPAALTGAFAYHYIKQVLFSPMVVGAAMIAGGVIMLIVERVQPPPQTKSIETISVKTALAIGLFQVTALVPGISRAGASIIGALFLGVERRTATEFSFLLAIPTILGAAAYDLFRSWGAVSATDIPFLLVGTFASFISAMIVIRWFLNYVSKNNFTVFAWYRIAVGVLVIGIMFSGAA